MRARTLGVALPLALAALLLCCSSALAARAHPFLSTLALPVLPGTAPDPEAVAVDSHSGDVFAGDVATGAGVVDVFGPTGTYLTQFGAGDLEALNGRVFVGGIAADSAGRVYVAWADQVPSVEGQTEARGVVSVFKPDGFGGYNLLSEWRGQGTPFGNIVGLAVDDSTSPSDPAAGNVYVANEGAGLIDVLKPPPASEEAKEGTLIATLQGQPKFQNGANVTQAGDENSLAVSASTGNVYAANDSKHVIEVFSPPFSSAGALPERTITGVGAPKPFEPVSLAVEEPAENLYVRFGPAVDEFNVGGELIGSTSTAATAAPITPQGIAIDNSGGSSRGRLYVADGAAEALVAGALDVYAASVPAPTVTTGKAGKGTHGLGTGATTVTLNGTINPEGEASTYHFEYRETGAASFISTAAEAVSGSSPLAVQATVALAPETKYQFRLVGESGAAKTPAYGLPAEFGPTPAAVSVATGAAASVGPNGATLTGSLSPQSVTTEYHLEYGETIGYGKSTPPVTTSSKSPVAAEVPVSGLLPGRTYHFRIVATNEFGTSGGQDATFTTTPAGPPAVNSESAAPTPEPAPPGSETLKAQISTNGEPSQSHYHFELGESETYGTSTPEAEVPAGASVSAEFTGLTAQTTYHFRVVAMNGSGETKSADATFTTSVAPGVPAPTLPDGRRYELVSPPEKHGGHIVPLLEGGGGSQASADGNALTYVVVGPIVENPEGNGGHAPQQVLATRGSASWTSQELVAPSERLRGGSTLEYTAFSDNLSLALTQPVPQSSTPLAEPPLTPPLSAAELGHQEKTIYLRADAPLAPTASQAPDFEQARHNGEALAAERGASSALPGYLALVSGANTPVGTKYGGVTGTVRGTVKAALRALGGTPDMTHVVFGSVVPLTAAPSSAGLYEWSAGGFQLVSVLPSGQPATGQPPDLGSGTDPLPTNRRHAISGDGSRVIWSTKTNGLFLRDTVRGETVQLDAPALGVNPTPAHAHVVFQDASADDSKVFFTDTEPLTPDAKASLVGEVENPDLYECEVVEQEGKLACALSDLSAPQGTAEPAGVKGVVGASEDGSYVYVLANGVLAPGAQPGADNLYVLHEEAGTWSTGFIATLSPEDFPDWGANSVPAKVVESVIQTARVSPNGHFLAFMSNRRLTGYDNTDVNEEGGPHADEEVFLYHAAEPAHDEPAKLSCPSCNPTGARPRGVLDTGNAGEGEGLLVDQFAIWRPAIGKGGNGKENPDNWLAGSIPGGMPASVVVSLHQPRSLSDSGRLFFNSADPLVPEAAGRTRPETIIPGQPPAAVGVENVYQYEPAGVGDCATAAGCVALISSGTSERESALLDASTTGDDVFFMTASGLLPQDTDGSYDIYDARVCGSSPCQVPPPLPGKPCASIEGCRPATAPEALVSPLTPGVSGPGNTTHLVASRGSLGQRSSSPPLTKVQKLARALKACRKLPHRTHAQKHRRSSCEAHARALYAPRHKPARKHK